MNINRRRFLQGLGVIGANLAVPGLITTSLFSGKIMAAGYDQLDVEFDTTLTVDRMPRFINIFLYGGPSELAGNLSNIIDINANSQNRYPRTTIDGVSYGFDPNEANSLVTPNAFWKGAGGEIMESLLASGDMTVYRTMNRLKDTNRAHGICVHQNLVGNLNVYTPGMATTLAWILQNNNPFRYADGSVRPLSDVVFPFVSFEGESKVFNTSDLAILPELKPIALNAKVLNPYVRTDRTTAGLNNGGAIDLAIEELARQTSAASAYPMTHQSLIQRAEAAVHINEKIGNVTDNAATYGYGTGNFGERLSSAVSLVLNNPDTLFVSVGSGGLGGWDDHSEMMRRYPARMEELFVAINAAVKHLEAATAQGVAHADKVIINVYGEFGRNVNLNESLGWDHGTNQNLYTFGGKGLSANARKLGEIVGTTERVGDSGVNRQFTSPTAGSYQFEPFALASSMYHYFGVKNPQVFSGEPVIAGF
ncbi:MAG: DUF1501 domain-containing protein [Gammaproteobacteria bacterium]|nr:DUF1501 domain-containing protein [Gammaproteobacteria bacterium]